MYLGYDTETGISVNQSESSYDCYGIDGEVCGRIYRITAKSAGKTVIAHLLVGKASNIHWDLTAGPMVQRFL